MEIFHQNIFNSYFKLVSDIPVAFFLVSTVYTDQQLIDRCMHSERCGLKVSFQGVLHFISSNNRTFFKDLFSQVPGEIVSFTKIANQMCSYKC